ncbi:MerR family transcriptional regulator [Roseomonas marmotae]|uniref:MerR family transcriptional regulator n=1 Tax=Roseomonas marmotae TaxID=2768161 RepID=A0ABS3KFH2_9PROT|nr:MerR family transcriptional regulator [Roseomonas marmotae]MBO1076225.1 MerR family transcriptional regulator [Roseomonas marmotae]QTI77890.1 MerR family transcriptional regulator [Roseomonas marmotae]
MSDEDLPGPGEEQEPAAEASGRLRKAPTAFRTISEVAEDLNIPQHVLRFWETKFPQLKPLKRGGGRRYYRPEDIALLRRIGDLLYTQGYTIKGVQRLLREGGLDAAEPQDAEAELPAPESLPVEPGQMALREAMAELEVLSAELHALIRTYLPS